MIEYKCVKICWTGKQTEKMLNKLSIDGWELVCSYVSGWLILKKIERRSK